MRVIEELLCFKTPKQCFWKNLFYVASWWLFVKLLVGIHEALDILGILSGTFRRLISPLIRKDGNYFKREKMSRSCFLASCVIKKLRLLTHDSEKKLLLVRYVIRATRTQGSTSCEASQNFFDIFITCAVLRCFSLVFISDLNFSQKVASFWYLDPQAHATWALSIFNKTE